MAYVPTFRNDVFLCHAHNDDRPRRKGWVSAFRADLEQSLSDRLGKVKVFMDDELSPDERYRSKLENEVRKSAIFVPILSPSILLSRFCAEEYEWFEDSHRSTTKDTSVSLIFKVVRLPDLKGMIHYWARGIDSVPFYVKERGSDVVLQQNSQAYRDTLEFLAAKIAVRLDSLKSQFDPVFVAYRPNTSLSIEVRKLETALEDQGHQIYPGSIIIDFAQAREPLSAQIGESKYCVFLLGAEYNDQIEDLVQIAEEQNKERIFWIARQDYKRMDDIQRAFVRRLEASGLTLYTGDFFSGFQDFLESLPLHSPGPLNLESGSKNLVLYVISDKKGPKLDRARKVVEQIEKENSQQPEPVSLSPLRPVCPPDGPPSLISSQHEEILSSCDAVLIYWELGDKLWLRETWREIVDRKTDGRAAYRSAAIFSAKTDRERHIVIESLKAEEEVIGRPEPAQENVPAGTDPQPPGLMVENAIPERLFDPAKLRRFLTSLKGQSPSV
jgi:TIR domain